MNISRFALIFIAIILPLSLAGVALAEVSYLATASAAQPGNEAIIPDKGVSTQESLPALQPVSDQMSQTPAASSHPGALFWEDFEAASFPPTGWKIINHGGNCEWLVGDPTIATNNTGGEGKYALADSDRCGIGTTMSTSLETRPVDLSGAMPGAFLRFSYDYHHLSSQKAIVSIRPTASQSWIKLHIFNSDDRGPKTIDLPLTAYIGYTDTLLRFSFDSPGWNYGWQVDNVAIYQPVIIIGRHVAPAKAEIGLPVAYTILLNNSGFMASANTEMNNPLPAGTTYRTNSLSCQGGTTSSCSYLPTTKNIYWQGSIPAAGTVTITFALDTPGVSCGALENVASINDPSQVVSYEIGSKTVFVPDLLWSWDFEQDNGGFTSDGIAGHWEWGKPDPAFTSGPKAAHSGVNVWGTNLKGNYDFSSASVISKVVDLTAVLTPFTGLAMQWWEWYELDISPSNADEGVMSINGAPVHTIKGSSQGQWIHRQIDLTGFVGQVITIQWRLNPKVYRGAPGWYLDDLSIHTFCTHIKLVSQTTSRTVCPATPQEYSFDLFNRTGAAEMFDLRSNKPEIMITPTQVALPPLGKYTLVAQVNVPPNAAYWSSESFTITASGQFSRLSAFAAVKQQFGPSWIEAAPAPVIPEDYSAFGEYNSKGYLFNRTSTWRYDPFTRQWDPLASQPDPQVSEPSDVCYGLNSDFMPVFVLFPNLVSGDDLKVYDIQNDTWYTSTAPAGFPVQGLLGQDITIDKANNHCFISGGVDNNYEFNLTLYEYDVNSNTVITHAGMTTPRREHASWLVGDKVCVGGGLDAGRWPLDSTQCYNTSTGAWEAENITLGRLPYTLWGMADAEKWVYGEEQLWVIGGNPYHVPEGEYTSTARTAYWSSFSGSWHEDARLLQPVEKTEAEVLAGKLFIVGGRIMFASGESYSTPANQAYSACTTLLENPSFSVSSSSTRFNGADVLTLGARGVEVAIPANNLGLTPGDDLDALSFGYDNAAEPYLLNFSTREGSAGEFGTALAAEASCSPAETSGDEYGVPFPGQNKQVFDENGVSCASNQGRSLLLRSEEDLDALVGQLPYLVDSNGDRIPEKPVYFSLRAGSAWLAASTASAADILVTQGGAPPAVFAPFLALGLTADDDLDGLMLIENGNGIFDPATVQDPNGDIVVFSLAAGSPLLALLSASPGDLLTPNKYQFGNPAMLAFPAKYSGLAFADDMDAVKGDANFFWKLAPFPPFAPAIPPTDCILNPVGGIQGWDSKAPLPLPREGGFATLIGDWIYVGHGQSNFGDDTFTFAYQRSANAWYHLPPAPAPRSEMTSVCARHAGAGKVFVIGGRDLAANKVLSDTYIYDPGANGWTKGVSMPTPRAGLGAVWVPSLDSIFAIGGRDGLSPHSGAPLNTVEAYNLTTGVWETKPPLLKAVMDVYATIYYSPTNSIYVFGGYDGITVTNVVQRLDLTASPMQWEILPSAMPTARSNALAGVCEGKIYVIGGYDGVKEYDVNEAFNPLNGSWSTALPLPSPRSEFMAQGVSTGAEIYAIGDGIHNQPDVLHDVFTCGQAPVGSAIIGNRVWHDLDADGIQELGEAGLPGATVKLYWSDNRLFSTTVTSVSGFYTFTKVPAGAYYLLFERPNNNWYFSPLDKGGNDALDSDAEGTTGKTISFSISDGEVQKQWDAGLFKKIELRGIKYLDRNLDGAKGILEPALSNWLITVMDGVMVLTTTTNQNGEFFFSVPPGTYTILEALPPGWEQSQPGPPLHYQITVTSGQVHQNLDFGNYQAGQISGRTFNDLNGNGSDDAEPGLVNWLIFLDKNSNGVRDSGEGGSLTDSRGYYTLTNLVPGIYTVTVKLLSGWFQTVPLNPPVHIVSLASGIAVSGKSFGVAQTASLGDRVWYDANANGIQDSGADPERGVPGITVKLFDSRNTLVLTTTTGLEGRYLFTNLIPGSYYLEFKRPKELKFTNKDQGSDDSLDSDADPASGRTILTTLSIGENDLSWDAGLFRDDLFAYKPDLWLNPPSVRAGESPDIGLTVRRASPVGTLVNITVTFYLGNPQQGGQFLGNGFISSMPPRSSVTTTVSWQPAPGIGSYLLYAVIDPDNTIPESDETNNVISRTVTVLPAPTPTSDFTPPRVISFTVTLAGQAAPAGLPGGITNDPHIKLNVNAQDNTGGSGVGRVAYVERVFNQDVGRWVVAQSSGWLAYGAANHNYPWTLTNTPGVHYLQAWAADKAGNISLNFGVWFVNYLPLAVSASIPGERTTPLSPSAAPGVLAGEIHLYRLFLQAGQMVTIKLTSITGDADLFVFSSSGLVGSSVQITPLDTVSFQVFVDGIYQVEVEGFAEYSLYTLEALTTMTLQPTSQNQPLGKARTLPVMSVIDEPSTDAGLPSAPVYAAPLYLPMVRK